MPKLDWSLIDVWISRSKENSPIRVYLGCFSVVLNVRLIITSLNKCNKWYMQVFRQKGWNIYLVLDGQVWILTLKFFGEKKKIHLLVFLVGGQFIGYCTPLHYKVVQVVSLQLYLEIFDSIIALNILYLLHSCEGQNKNLMLQPCRWGWFSKWIVWAVPALPYLMPSEQHFDNLNLAVT